MSIPTPFNPLGTLGGELPPGYTRLLAVEFDKRQGFYTGVNLADSTVLKADIQGVGYTATTSAVREMCVFSTRPNYGNGSGGNTFCAAQSSLNSIDVYPFNGTVASYPVAEFVINQRNSYVWGKTFVSFNGEEKSITDKTTYNKEIHVGFGLDSFGRRLHAKVYGLQIFNAGQLVRNYVPALDDNGRACMYETVEKSAVYSELSADFLPIYKS